MEFHPVATNSECWKNSKVCRKHGHWALPIDLFLAISFFITGCSSAKKQEKIQPIILSERPEISNASIPKLILQIELCTDLDCGEKTFTAYYKDNKPYVRREMDARDPVSVTVDSPFYESLWARVAKLPVKPVKAEELSPCKASFHVKVRSDNSEWDSNFCRTQIEYAKSLSYVIRDIEYIVLKKQAQGAAEH